MNSGAEYLLVPVFMNLADSIPETCLERVSNWFVTGFAVNTISYVAIVCTQLCGCSKATLTAASTVTRLCCSLFKRAKKYYLIYNIYNTEQFFLTD